MTPEPLRLLPSIKKGSLPRILVTDGETIRAESSLVRDLVPDDVLLGVLLGRVIDHNICSGARSASTPDDTAFAQSFAAWIRDATGCDLGVAKDLIAELVRVVKKGL